MSRKSICFFKEEVIVSPSLSLLLIHTHVLSHSLISANWPFYFSSSTQLFLHTAVEAVLQFRLFDLVTLPHDNNELNMVFIPCIEDYTLTIFFILLILELKISLHLHKVHSLINLKNNFMTQIHFSFCCV